MSFVFSYLEFRMEVVCTEVVCLAVLFRRSIQWCVISDMTHIKARGVKWDNQTINFSHKRLFWAARGKPEVSFFFGSARKSSRN